MAKQNIENSNSGSRITFIVGAGAPLDFTLAEDMVKPTTGNITQEVIKPYKYPLSRNKVKTVQRIYDILKSNFPADHINDWKSFEKPQPDINFEQLFHVLEMYKSYDKPWEGECHNPDIYPEFAPFTRRKVKLHRESLHHIIQEFIHRIMEFVDKYDKYYQNNIAQESWYQSFFAEFEGRSDIFTFNYDTTIEHSLSDYEDGFENVLPDEDFMRFNPNKLWQNTRYLSTVNHLHGCINYFFDTAPDDNRLLSKYQHRDLCKYGSFDEVHQKWIGRGWGDTQTQSGEEYFPSPIITGLRKTDKLVGVPFDFYHGKLYDSIMHSNKLVIIGYSFGDLYVNQLFDRMDLIHGDKKRIVLIDYWNNRNSYTDKDGNKVKGEELDLGYFCENRINAEMMKFILMMAGITDTQQLQTAFNTRYQKSPMVSSNGNLMILPNKFKEASTHLKEIVAFLES